MPSIARRFFICRPSIVNCQFLILLLCILPLTACGKRTSRKALEKSRYFAEIVKRQDARRIGEDAFFETLRAFLEEFQFGSASTSDFIEAAEDASGEDLQSFFDAWLYEVEPPPLPGYLP